MANLYLTEQNSILRKTGDRLIVQKNDETLLDVQCHKIEAVLIFGNVQFTTQVVHELFEHGIEMAILTRSGRLIGQITSPATKNIALRIEQFRKYEDEGFRTRISREIVAGKIGNCLQILRNFSYNHPDIDLGETTAGLKAKFATVEAATGIEQLMGIEGDAARTYFQGFGRMVLGDFGFPGRRKRPATDPVNAMLSLSYTMIFNEISSLLDGLGFDPYLGYFHSVTYGRQSLAADLMEEFRAPVADRLTLRLINDRIFSADDFRENPGGEAVYFKREAMKRYFAEYEKMITGEFTLGETGEQTTLRKCFRRQAEKMAAVIRDDVAYVPFKPEG